MTRRPGVSKRKHLTCTIGNTVDGTCTVSTLVLGTTNILAMQLTWLADAMGDVSAIATSVRGHVWC